MEEGETGKATACAAKRAHGGGPGWSIGRVRARQCKRREGKYAAPFRATVSDGPCWHISHSPGLGATSVAARDTYWSHDCGCRNGLRVRAALLLRRI